MSEKKYVDYATIVAAKNGDISAMKEILKFYEHIIKNLARINLFDEYGRHYYGIDEDLCRDLELKLIVSTLTFEIRED